MTNVLYALLGGVLVVFGVMAAALADRLRGIKAQRSAERSAAPRDAEFAAERVKHAARPRTTRVIPGLNAPPNDTLDVISALGKVERPKIEARMTAMATDVIAALVASGYKKDVAAEAAWGCGATERATLEGWTLAALQRAGKGVLS